jgi:hypothetical protein
MRNIMKTENPWQSHDWKVKTLISVTRGGSRLAFTCRSCERTFTHMTGNNQTWATDGHDVALADTISQRWLSEICPVSPVVADVADRLNHKNPPAGSIQ